MGRRHHRQNRQVAPQAAQRELRSEGLQKLTSLYDKDHVDIELEAYGMEARPTAEIIEVVKDACAFAF